MSSSTRSVCFALLQAQQTVALLQRCQPLNMRRELARLQRAFREGTQTTPRFEYARVPRLDGLRSELAAFAELASCGPWGELLAERAAEIANEAALVQTLGTPSFVIAAHRRYWQPHAAAMTEASVLVKTWLDSPRTTGSEGKLHRTDDRHDPESLLRRIETLLGERRLPFRVQVISNLVPVAATGDGVILIAEGRQLSALETARVAVHEVLAHALPRALATAPLWQLGTAGAADEEEGRALLIEQRHDLMGEERRFALALRHLAAQALFDGASYVEVVRLLLDRGCASDQAVMVTARVFRGGGLGREIVYLPALLRVSAGLRADPSLEQWLERGRVALHWAPRLKVMG
ncbi:MAG TPA: tyrosine/phenylalanine carboxypeptidase domain-containing protein, partial [Polyangiaceae bacterium]|nr:tyrosine/phenylalanine carboxypeptidase domain-containing protein [Polyangiaceae bacterium]